MNNELTVEECDANEVDQCLVAGYKKQHCVATFLQLNERLNFL